MFSSDTYKKNDPLPTGNLQAVSSDIRQQSMFNRGTSRFDDPLPTTPVSSGDSQDVSSVKRRRTSSHGDDDDVEDSVRSKRKCGSVCEGVVVGNVDTDINDKSVIQELSVAADCGISDSLQVDTDSSTVEVCVVEEVQVEESLAVPPLGSEESKMELLVVEDDSSEEDEAVSGTELFVDESSDESES